MMLILRPTYLRRRRKSGSYSRRKGAVSVPAEREEQIEVLLAHFRHEGRLRRKAQGQFRYITWLAIGIVGCAWFSDLITGQFSMEWVFSHWLFYLLVLAPACVPIGVSHIEREIGRQLAWFRSPKAVGALLQARELGDADYCLSIDQALLQTLERSSLEEITLTYLERRSLHRTLHDAGFDLVEALLPIAVHQGDRETLQTLSRLTNELFSPSQSQLRSRVEQAIELLSSRLDQEAQPNYLLRSSAPDIPMQSLLRPARGNAESTLLLRSINDENSSISYVQNETINSSHTSLL